MKPGGPVYRWSFPAGKQGCVSLSKDETQLFLRVYGVCKTFHDGDGGTRDKEIEDDKKAVAIKVNTPEGKKVVEDFKKDRVLKVVSDQPNQLGPASG